MKKFDQPFDFYEIASDRPMAIELHPQGVVRYVHLATNPIYYFHALQYVHGSLYRAILGYETIWDSKFEDLLVRHLDRVLVEHSDRREYYLDEIVFKTSLKLWGLPWRRGVKPRLHFQHLWCKPVLAGARATIRVNVIDSPHHVDIEFYDGEIYTVSYMRYLRWKNKDIRSLNARRTVQAKPDHTTTKEREPRETLKAKRISRAIPTRSLASQLSPLWKRLRRS